MFSNYEPGDYVINPNNKGWGTGQIQSIINFRDYNGYFTNIYELKNVEGITIEKIHELKSFITLFA